MDIKTQIKGLFKEAELYQSQGLLKEARGKYREALKVVQNIKRLKNKESIIAGIRKKIERVEKANEDISKAPKVPELASDTQNLIQNLFASDKGDDVAAFEGAIALAKFGQFEKALSMFEQFVDNAGFRFVASKNVLKCHVALANVEEAVALYDTWLKEDRFTNTQSEQLYLLLTDLFTRKGFSVSLSKPERKSGSRTPGPEPGKTKKEIDLSEFDMDQEETIEEFEFIDSMDKSDYRTANPQEIPMDQFEEFDIIDSLSKKEDTSEEEKSVTEFEEFDIIESIFNPEDDKKNDE